MPVFSQHPNQRRVKLLLVGDPGAGKTGLLATLANEDYKVRILDLDNNLAILNAYLKEGKADNISYYSIPAKDPDSWKKSIALTTKWNPPGEDLGDLTEWDSKTVLVIDSATFWNEVCMAQVLKENGIADDKAGFDQSLWGVMNKRFENQVARLTSDRYKFHLIFIAHIRLIENKKTGGIMRAFPSFLGQQLPNIVARYMNNVWLATRNKDGKPSLTTQTTRDMGYLKCSAPHRVHAEAPFDLGAVFKQIEA
jgi:hypothetical protein